VLLKSVPWTAAMPQGQESQSEAIEISGVPTPLFDVTATIDGGDDASAGVVDECYESNNTDTWGAYVCP
jgi:hypothetical protein